MQRCILLVCVLLHGITSAQTADDFASKLDPHDRFVDQLEPDEVYTVSVTATNNGQITWPKGDIKMHMQIAGRYEDQSTAEDIFTHDVPLNADVIPGKYFVFKWTIKAPDWPGKWKTQCYLMFKGKRFGEIQEIEFEVPDNLMEYKVLMTVGGDLRPAPEEECELKYTIKNVGEFDWPEGDYSLKVWCSTAPSGASSEEKTTFNFEQKIAEFTEGLDKNAYDEIKFKTTTPRTPGSYRINAKLYLNGKDFSTASGDERNFTLTVPEEEPILTITRVTLEDDMTYGRPYDVVFTVRNNGTVRAEANKWEIRSVKSDPYNKNLEFVLPGKIDIEERESDTLKGDDKVKLTAPPGGAASIPDPYRMKFQIYYEGKPMGRVFNYDVTFVRK